MTTVAADKRPLRVCYFGAYRSNYVRNQVLIEGLQRNGVEVEQCHSPLWHSTADRIEQASGGWKNPRFWWRVGKAYLRLLIAHGRTQRYDVMMIGYPGQFDVYLGRLLSWRRRRPLVLDILMSLHLIAEERGLTARSPSTGALLFWLEKYGLKLPDLLIADTPEYRTYYCEKYGLQPARFALVPLGVDDRVYRPMPEIQPPSDSFRVIYYGTFIPLHGVETMIRAAAALQDDPRIQFDFYGDGQERRSAEQLIRALNLKNIQLHGWVPKEELPGKIAQSHLVLGVFGTSKQSLCTIQNKIWEAMIMQRPVISGDAETIRAELKHLEHIYLVARADPLALAEGIRYLAAHPQVGAQMVSAAYERVQQHTIRAIGLRMKQHLERAVDHHEGRVSAVVADA